MTEPVGPPPAAVRPAAARAAGAVARIRQRVAQQHAAGADPLATWTLATDLFDELLGELWQSIIADLPPASAAVADRVAVVATGGYGRREMAPFSDLDVMLLHDGQAGEVVIDLATRLVQDLFDAGLQVGQSVRTAAEACRLAAGDATILSSLLDARPVLGPPAAVERLAARLRRIVRRRPQRYAEQLLATRQEEADRFGQTVSLLEPNVKRSPGGLRDIQLAHWLGQVLHAAESFDELVAVGRLDRRDAATLRDAAEFLAVIRTDLHLEAGRASDDLTRDQQARIAAAQRIEARDGLLGVEHFMRTYIGHTRGVKRVVEALATTIHQPVGSRLIGRLLGHPVEGRYRVGPAAISLVPGAIADTVSDPAAVVRLLELGLLHGLPIDPASWEALRVGLAGGANAAPPSPSANGAFLRLFMPPAGAIPQWRTGLADLLRRLHELGILEQFVPGFAHARDLLQFNNYHKYTVDEHCILAVERCLGFATDSDWLGRVWRGLNRPRPLLLALLFHDLGKGYPGDHSEVGAAMALETAGRLGLPDEETEIVEFLVRRHLLMSHLAFRRDVGDDSIVAGFAREVGSPETLRMLTVLTAADVAAVGPGTWTSWKADLLADLYNRTQHVLAGEPLAEDVARGRAAVEDLVAGRAADDPVREGVRQLPAAALRGVPPARVVEELGRLGRLTAGGVFVLARWQPETATVSITVGTDREAAAGAFHRVTGALAAQRLEVLAADIHTLPAGHLLDRFTVRDPDFAGEPPPERLTEIAETIRVAVRTAATPQIQRQWNPFAPQLEPAGQSPVRVGIDNETSREVTIIEVFAHDSPGLLFQVARTLHEAEISIRAARIGTYLDQVVDAFHVTDSAGRKIADPARLRTLREDITLAVAPITGPR
jgi:[protein-PII] uridylyltransferase